MVYVFKCKNEECDVFDIDTEIEQRVSDKHKAKCKKCKRSMQRVFTIFTIGLPQGQVSMDGVKIPAARKREMDRRKDKKTKAGGGEYWDKSKKNRIEE